MELTWPAVGLLLGLVVILVFRKPLSGFLERARRIGPTGIDADAAPQDVKASVKPSVAEELQKVFDNALLVQRESQLRTELDRINFKDASEREKFLIRLLIVLAISQTFERTYFRIWGSQLGALHYLNTAGLTGADLSLIRKIYDQASTREPTRYEKYSFDQWLGFLQSSQLIVRKDNLISISLEGREFLKYLLQQGYPLYKRG